MKKPALILSKTRNMSQNLSSAAVVIGALRIKSNGRLFLYLLFRGIYF